MLISLAAAAIVFAILIAGPGFAILRRSGWEAEEILAAAPGLSIVAVGLARFLLFAAGASYAADLLITAACALLAIVSVRGAASWIPTPAARRALGAFALLAAWVLLLVFTIRNYGAGNWNTDWAEHYERARFFLGWQALDRTFIGSALPARPPLFNLFASQVMAATGTRYPAYQLTTALVALLGFFPVLLLAREFAPRAARLPWVVVAWLMLSPMFVENATYPLTKQTAAWMAVAALALYLRARRTGDAGRMIAAFVLAAGGVLVHYSAAPYALFLGFHYLASTWRHRARRMRELAAVAAAPVLILGPWLAWCAVVFGPAAIATTTASWHDAQAYTGGSQVAKIALNIRDTIVPNFLRGVSTDARATGLTLGRLRETTFMAYQSNLLATPGILAVLLVVIDLVRRRRGDRRWPPPGPLFWCGFVLTAFLLGLATHGARDQTGLAHLVMQPVVLVVLAYLAAASLSWGPVLRVIALAGLAVDLALGIALHFWLQVYPLDLPVGWHGPLGLKSEDLFIGYTEANWLLKQAGRLVFIGDGAPWVSPAFALAALFLAVVAFMILAEPARDEGG